MGGGGLGGGSVGDGGAVGGSVDVAGVDCPVHVGSGVNVGHKTHVVGAEPPLEDAVVASAAAVALFVATSGTITVSPACSYTGTGQLAPS